MKDNLVHVIVISTTSFHMLGFGQPLSYILSMYGELICLQLFVEK